MKVAYRVAGPEDVGRWDGDFAQLSVYRQWEGSIESMQQCVSLLKDRGIRYVMHPVNYSLIGEEEEVEAVKLMAGLSDLALILHDERAPGGGRLTGRHEARFLGVLKELEEMAPVSFENANNTQDAPWFWERYARRVTLDIGHVEGAGLDSVEYVKSLPDSIVDKIDYVHMHRNNGFRGGLTDHWPLREGCRELKALRKLLERRTEFSIILEINEVEEINDSIALIRALWKDVKGE
jgi:sugar phosphate isomerase/epimerase